MLPALSAVLVKFLMATLHANAQGMQPIGNSTNVFPILSSRACLLCISIFLISEMFVSQAEQPPPPPPPPTMEEMDLVRHREITNEAISAIILLLLKWFKVSRKFKFVTGEILIIDKSCVRCFEESLLRTAFA